MPTRVNRRQLLSATGALGGAAAASLVPAAQAGRVELGRFANRSGVGGRMTGAQAAAAALGCQGVACVFGIPGAQNNEFWDALKARSIPYLLVAHEASASVMADAAARVTGEVGVFSVVPGPGITNCLTGLGEALHDGFPLVGVITDIDRSPGARLGQVHGLRNADLIRPVVKALLEVHHQAEIPGAILEAFRIARAGEPGPTAVLIPYPLFTAIWDYNTPAPPPYPAPFDEAAYGRVLAHLCDLRQRVGIYAGMGCAGASHALTAVAELLQAPVATSVTGKGCIADSHPLAVGWGYGGQGTRAAEAAFKSVDLLLAVGVRYSEVSTAYYAIPPHNPLIHVDINPHNLGKNVPTHVTLCSDAGLFLNRLLADAHSVRRSPCPALYQRIGNWRQVDRVEAATPRITKAVDPMLFLKTLRDSLGPEELFFVDVTASTHWASESVEVQAPRRYFTPTNNQSMGWAIPAAIAGQFVRPDRQVACVTGDGCFLMAGMEISTAARRGLPVKFFVLDDGAYHYMQMLQEPVYRRTTATDLARIDYAAFAQAMGVGFNQIACNADVAAGIARALATPGPVLTRIVASYEGREIRWLSTLRGQYLKKMPNNQKIRLAARIGVRTLAPADDND